MRAGWLAAAPAALAALSVEAADTEKFDLTCQGFEAQLPAGVSFPDAFAGGVTEGTPWSSHLRIDLESGHWCQDDCGTVREIVRVTPDEITLANVRTNVGFILVALDRRTGRYQSGLSAGVRKMVKAECQKAPFSGFPAVKF